ncbi:hypothetical protein BV22DRAFT_594861 [Leucogyrophana mollusca]|uniref:Uncharacterized protein n=1 Tax=Leucogyrophana mollusca TaxID=85980 RepID=A0ACB8BDH6_9AGAM|nr:hypothetical protein BV22DRAFT_594861 [Leucogyrophana mollusca]
MLSTWRQHSRNCRYKGPESRPDGPLMAGIRTSSVERLGNKVGPYGIQALGRRGHYWLEGVKSADPSWHLRRVSESTPITIRYESTPITIRYDTPPTAIFASNTSAKSIAGLPVPCYSTPPSCRLRLNFRSPSIHYDSRRDKEGKQMLPQFYAADRQCLRLRGEVRDPVHERWVQDSKEGFRFSLRVSETDTSRPWTDLGHRKDLQAACRPDLEALSIIHPRSGPPVSLQSRWLYIPDHDIPFYFKSCLVSFPISRKIAMCKPNT